MARHDAVQTIDQNGIYETKLLDAGSDLFDLPGCVRAGIFETGFELSRVFVFDSQRLHSAPHARHLKDRPAHRIANRRFEDFPISFAGFPFSAIFFPIIFRPQNREKHLWAQGLSASLPSTGGNFRVFPNIFPISEAREIRRQASKSTASATDANRRFLVSDE
jgi:hypothetical protein